ncbi:alpha/beta fold hydrolase [Streptomyces sp. NPDC004270]
MTEATGYVAAETLHTTGHNGVTYAYRRLGPAGARPIVLLQHFRGNLDNWDPALIDALAADRDVITFDNVGVAGTTGTTPTSITEMAHDAITFMDSLDLTAVDLLGFSIGSFIAQEIALIRPSMLGKVVLASAAPQGAPGMHGWADDIIAAAGKPQTDADGLLHSFFRGTSTSRECGVAFLKRLGQRSAGRDEATTWQTRNAQYDAVLKWGTPNLSLLQRPTAITLPVFITNGDDDRMILPWYSYLLRSLIPDSEVKIYPDSAHGFLFQHHQEFSADVLDFLS